MTAIIDPHVDPPGSEEGSRWRRLAWFVGLWAGGVASVGLVGGVIRLWLFHL
jgi:hypothetical protein